MLRHAPYIAMVLLILCPGVSIAQTTINPDISVVPRFLVETNDGARLPDRREFGQLDLSFQELEIAIQSYLNPYAKADVVMTLPGPDLESGKLGLEELYATLLRGLPFDLNLRFGKYRVDYGKLNTQHPHTWSFITQPLSQERFLGEEGLNDLGLSSSVLLPTGDIYSKLTVDVLRGASIGEAAGIEDTSGTKPTYATSARFMGFFTLGDYSDLETGISMYTGIHDPYNRDRFWYWNYDFKYKYKPSTYTSLVLQGEILYNMRKANQDGDMNQFMDGNGNPERRAINSSGLYFFADYQFFKIFSVGGRFDWSQSPYSKDDKATAVVVFFGYYPVEETLGLRLQYQNTKDEMSGFSQAVNSIALQILFSFGHIRRIPSSRRQPRGYKETENYHKGIGTMNSKLMLLMIVLLWTSSRATVRVVTTLPDLADLTQQIGGDRVKVDFIVRGNQNPHFVDVKPSYMMKLKSADVFLMIGMELELWAPQIVDGSRNMNLDVVDLSKKINKLEVPSKLDASQGDVHRYGNPHYWLDPRNVHTIVEEIIASLAKASPSDEQFFKANAEAYLKKLDAKIVDWEKKMKASRGSKIITFHKSWSYFADWLGLVIADQVEPKPGIPPSPSHTTQLIQLVRTGNIKAIIVEPFYDVSAPEQIARSTSAKVLQLPTSVGGADAAKDYISMMDYNIETLAAALQ